MTPPPTGTFEVDTLGPLGAFAVFDADGFGEVAWAVGDGDVGAGVSWAAGVVAGVAEGVPRSPSAEQPASAAAPALARASSPAVRSTVRRCTASAGCATSASESDLAADVS
jgi:hypothetical protein